MEKWHAITARYIGDYGIFDDWGMFAYTNGAYKPWGDYLAEIDIGIWEQRLSDENWADWVDCKREIARSRSNTAARSPPATARPVRAMRSSCRSKWAAGST